MKLPIPDDWDGSSWCRWAICWPNSELWEGILRGFVSATQRGRTWDEKTGSIISVQEIGREITALNLPLKEVFMACGDEGLQSIAQAIQALATATAQANNQGCCDDRAIDTSGGYQGSAPSAGGDVPIYGTQPPVSLPEGETFPPEFTDLQEFQAHKCSIAHAIFDGVLLTLAFLSGLNVANLTGLAAVIGLGIAGIIIFPPSAIVIMIGFLFTLSGFLTMFLSIRDQMIENKEDFICAMYDSASVTETISVIADLLDIIIATITTTGPIATALKFAMLLLFNSDTLNQLYDKSVDYLYPDADCSDCMCDQIFDWNEPDDALGFNVVDPSGLTVEHPTGSAGGVYQLTAHVTDFPGSYYWKSPALGTPRLVQIGDRIQSRATQMPVTTLYLIIYLQSNPNEPVIVGGSGTASGEVIYDMSLDAWEGETIVAMAIYSGWGYNGDLVENFDYLRLVCA